MFGLAINLEKCIFLWILSSLWATPRLWPRGPSLSPATWRPWRKGLTTTTIKELEVVLGPVNFYRQCLPATAFTLFLLTDALKGNWLANVKLT
jgi:hypothetical protein